MKISILGIPAKGRPRPVLNDDASGLRLFDTTTEATEWVAGFEDDPGHGKLFVGWQFTFVLEPGEKEH